MNTETVFLRSILANPNDVGLRRIYADWLEEQNREDEADAIRLYDRIRVEATLDAIKSLRFCGFTPGSWDKKFVANICEAFLSESGEVLISPKRLLWVWKLVYKYRRQIRNRDLIKQARELVAPLASIEDLKHARSLFDDLIQRRKGEMQ